MPTVVLTGSNLKVSRVGLGLSRIHHFLRSGDRERLIRTAHDLGITHFDAARLYGDGIAERSLGRALSKSRSSVTIATKFGLIPNDMVGRLGSFARPIWAARVVLRRFGLSRWPGRSFTAATMRQSISKSLKSLRTDYVDILFLHEPAVSDLEHNQELIDSMVAERKAGKVRFFGLAGADHVKICAMYPGIFDVVQMPETAWDPKARHPDFTYSVIAPKRSELPGGDAKSDHVKSLLAQALQRRPNGGILVSTTKLHHLRVAVEAAEQASSGGGP